MPQLIKQGALAENTLELIEKDAENVTLSENSLAPLKLFLDAHAAGQLNGCASVWLDSDEGPEDLEPFLAELNVVAINFPKFVDGRGYSYARLLRDRYKFTGEVRAIGDVLHDQLYYMKRCGFDAYDIRADTDAQAAIEGLTAFSEAYQASTDRPLPLFRRRS